MHNLHLTYTYAPPPLQTTTIYLINVPRNGQAVFTSTLRKTDKWNMVCSICSSSCSLLLYLIFKFFLSFHYSFLYRHTGIVVYGKEYYFGGGILTDAPVCIEREEGRVRALIDLYFSCGRLMEHHRKYTSKSHPAQIIFI